MASLKQQIANLAKQLEVMRDTVPVDEQVLGLTLEQHSPGNGSTYTRLRAPKGKTLANGKRTMSLKAEDVQEWEQKIYARNQQAKIAQCLSLVQQAAEVADAIIWDFDEADHLVNEYEIFTKTQKEDATANTVKPRPKVTIKYILKDAKGATTINRTVHAIAEAPPDYDRWFSPALCGERPKAGTWGWRTCDPSELSCPKCYDKVQALS